jgi:hypothetical protein
MLLFDATVYTLEKVKSLIDGLLKAFNFSQSVLPFILVIHALEMVPAFTAIALKHASDPEENTKLIFKKVKVDYVPYNALLKDLNNCRCKWFSSKKVREHDMDMFQCNCCERWNHLECMNY